MKNNLTLFEPKIFSVILKKKRYLRAIWHAETLMVKELFKGQSCIFGQFQPKNNTEK